jgi:ketohexokinase
MSRILAVGTVTLDIINHVDSYPAENSEVRALGQSSRVGGNAANTLMVLGQLKHHCSLAAVLGGGDDGSLIDNALQRHDINTAHCHRISSARPPTSYVALSRRNGSRTIIHHRELPEFDAHQFAAIDTTGYDWTHFEGRDPVRTAAMLESARDAGHTTVSLEIEKARPGIESLIALADIVMFSRSYAAATRYPDATTLLTTMRSRNQNARLYAPWGEAGAWCLDRDGGLFHSPAFAPPMVVDTLGAGDCFNAAVIDGELRKEPVETILNSACRLAGHKCGRHGLERLFED